MAATGTVHQSESDWSQGLLVAGSPGRGTSAIPIEFAERMRALGSCPDGRSDTVATTTLPRFPPDEQNVSAVVDLITARLRAVVDTVRRVHAWMVSAENSSV
ncbi:hypothetical protein ABT189_03955 [Streptomyces sp900105755]|uniref:hypothetical protein n=1 Tax=Streptomyces sp. 900105755 TaxID=3154389 RepID=UPI00331E1E77